jgi:hypothetical protein
MEVLTERLFRSGDMKYMLKMKEEGEIMFRPLIYYRQIEDPSRRDADEGKVVRHFTEGQIELSDKNGLPIPGLIKVSGGTLNLSADQIENMYVACFSFSAVRKFGISTVEIENPKRLVEALRGLLKKCYLELYYGRVEYYDPANVSLDLLETKVGFMKSEKFKDEMEYRFAFFMNEDHPYIEKLNTLQIAERRLFFSSKIFADCMKLHSPHK